LPGNDIKANFKDAQKIVLQMIRVDGGEYTAEVFNVSGQKVYGTTIHHTEGSSQYLLNTDNAMVGKGIYILKLSSRNGRQYREKLIAY